LDIGCGNGHLLKDASQYVQEAVGIEKFDYPKTEFDNILNIDIFDNNFNNNSFDIITFLDVMEHIEDENKFLQEVKRLIKPDGTIIITVPACKWLFSKVDIACHHYRRYSSRTLREVLEYNGLEIKKLSYMNFFLFPIFAAVRIKEKIFDVKNFSYGTSRLANTILYHVFGSEKALLKKVNLPFGSSLLAICKIKQ
ncbi:methyltransferase domain-containing protein, partial [Brachyspira pilosicoli]|uniref:class I SAM-dependent methyltransferase n=1 Tax=Brachyspira pilosicoli TaxID=52584 RepID=UPI001C66DDDB